MRVAYIVELDAFNNSGVLTKITSQVSIWNQIGADSRLFLISKLPGDKKEQASYLKNSEVNIYFSSLLNSFYKWSGRRHVYLNKIFTSWKVTSDIESFAPDVIYYRFGIWFPGQLYRFGKIPVIVELNSNDVDEIKLFDTIGKLIHLKTRGRLLNRADGFCAVTHEIQKTVAPEDTQCVVIGNGIDISNITIKKKSKNNRKQIVFVGSSDCPWHGEEKILYLARKLPGFDFHIVGPDLEISDSSANNVFFYGFIDASKLSQLYSKMDVAIGTLSLHKKNMMEASALKVREYVAYGLPVILGYHDTDLNEKNYILNIGNYENNVKDNINKIEQFINDWDGKVINSNLDCIDMHKKEEKRLNFFKLFIN